MSTVNGRVRHYGAFYGIPEMAAGKHDDRPVILVHGNCQAESLRVLLAGSETLGARTVRLPPVFEMSATDIPFLHRLAEGSQILLSQPVSDNYHGLPLGTDQVLAMMPAGSRVVRWPVVRFSGFHPYQAIVRDPQDPSRNPPVVPYHDLRTMASARTGTDRSSETVSLEAARAVADASRAELRRREREQCDVAISDVFDAGVAGDMATINHPGNRVLIELARRMQLALDRPADAADPGRTLLGDVVAPVERGALRAMKVSGAGRRSWQVSGRRVRSTTVHRTQWRFYDDNPGVLEAGYRRHGTTLEMLGLL